MTPKTGHTAGAMRAAHKILKRIRVYNELSCIEAVLPPADNLAELIDQETGAAELLEALIYLEEFPTAEKAHDAARAAIRKAESR